MKEKKDATIIVKTTVDNPEQNVIKEIGSTITEKTGNVNRKARKLIYYLLGIVEALLICRFVLRLLGANPVNTFVTIIYAITDVFLWPFSGIFRSAVTTGIETKSFLEPATIIAMIVYALIAWGIAKLVEILKTSHNTGNHGAI